MRRIDPRRLLRARVIVAGLGVLAALVLLAHCGGTTGREGEPLGSSMLGGGAGTDATVSTETLDAASDQALYTNTFDVQTAYANRALPDVQAPPEAGGDAGTGVPNCPVWEAFDDAGNVLSGPDTFEYEVAADYANNEAGEAPAAAGSVCATYPWYGSTTVDDCIIAGFVHAGTFDPLPACNWAHDAGVATGGPLAGAQRFDLCVALYQCFLRTGCFITPGAPSSNDLGCLCGSFDESNPGTTTSLIASCAMNPGPCFDEEINATETAGNDPLSQATNLLMNGANFATSFPNLPGFEGRTLNGLFDKIWPCYPACLAADAGKDCWR